MTVIERRLVEQDWYETETTKTGWDSHGWHFDGGDQMGSDWSVVTIIPSDKFGNAFVGIAERNVTINH
mgnify:CR=1 FL=1